MELGWFAISWLNPVDASMRLLKNVADTLVDVSMAAGLAARLFENPEGFFEFAKTFKPPEGFEDQYQDRLKEIKDRGILAMQGTFWRTEASCRNGIERAILGFRASQLGAE